ncbi:unnamed protein product, partial [Chrysoparadoxa australica]
LNDLSIVRAPYTFSDNALSITYRNGAFGAGHSGTQGRVLLDKALNTAFMSYSLWVPENFDFVRGGVLPGLTSGVGIQDGWTVEAAWLEAGQI